MPEDATPHPRQDDVRAADARLVRLSLKDSLAFIGQVTLPTLAKGPLVRRPQVVALAERLDLDGRAVRRMAALREGYGPGPVIVPLPGRPQAVILTPAHVARILHDEPEPFHPSTAEKRAALSHFEPDVSLVSTGGERAERRRFNEDVLEIDRPVHSMADAFLPKITEEAERMLAQAGGRLDWGGFVRAWYRVVRRIVLGDGARDDHALTRVLDELRQDANLVFLKRRNTGLRARFRAGVQAHLDRAEPGSLAERVAALEPGARAAPADQIAHYLFAFDPGGMTAFRALALLAAHPRTLARARAEAEGLPAARAELPTLRATILETLRLWPTTPAILRETTRDVDWGGETMRKGTHIIIYAPFFHRDDSLPFAHRFAPEIWTSRGVGRGRAVEIALEAQAIVPFSAGGGRCPAADFVPLVASAMLAAIVARRAPALEDPDRLQADAPMPALLDNYTLAFRLDPA